MANLIIFSLVAGIALAGCNTVEGVGKDVKCAGGSLEEFSHEAKP